jgi:RNA polymerase sigma factor (sigma-70 family)
MKELIARAIAGDSHAEREIFERLTVRFRFIAKRYMRDENAEDVAQDACLTILQKYKKQNFETGFEAWAYGVLRMKIGNFLQKQATVKKNIADGQMIENQAEISQSREDFELRRRLLLCLKKINRSHHLYARVLNLTHQGYTTDEICGMLQIKSNYLYVILNRGRKMLRKCLDAGEV